MRAPTRLRSRGFTLIEAVMVIGLTGIVAAMVALFIPKPIDAYIDQARRAELTDVADTALRRITRDLGQALPNSVRVDVTGQFLEYLPVLTTGRYRASPAASGVSDALDLNSAADNSFDVFGPTIDTAAGNQLVIYNLGIPGADAYNGDNVRALTSIGSGLSNLTYDIGAGQFPYPSPGNRFQIITTPVSLVCAPGAGGTGTLRRYSGYAIQASQPVDTTAAPLSGLTGRDNSLVADLVQSCSFAFSPGASARNGLVTVRLTLASGGESVTLMHQVHIDNSP